MFTTIGRSTDEDVCAGFPIPDRFSVIADSADGDGIRRGCPAIVIGVIAIGISIATSPDKNSAFTVTASGGGIDQCGVAEWARTTGTIGIVRRPPTVAFDLDDVLFEGKCVGFHIVSGGCGDESHADQQGLRRDATDAEIVVPSCSCHASAGGTMGVTRTWRGIIV